MNEKKAKLKPKIQLNQLGEEMKKKSSEDTTNKEPTK